MIEIDPIVSGGWLGERFDITIRGRATSDAAIHDVRLLIDGKVNSVSVVGKAGQEPDAALRRLVFQFNLPRPARGKPERCKFQIIARTDQDSEHVADYELALDHHAAQPVSVISGPTVSARPLGNALPHALIYIETATINHGGLLFVKGWAASFGRIVAVQIFVGEDRIANARIGEEREDVALVHPVYPNARLSGFSLTYQLGQLNRTADSIHARLVCLDGFGHGETIPVKHLSRQSSAGDFSVLASAGSSSLLAALRGEVALPGPKDAQVGTDIEMYCDEAQLGPDGTLFVNGWAVCASGVAQVRVLLDDQDVGLATFGHERNDVGRKFPELPMAHLSGFRFESRVETADDIEHAVRVIVCGGRGEESEKQVAVVTIGPVPPVSGAAAGERAPDLTSQQAAEFRFELDSPALADGTTVEPISSRLTIEGWLLSRSGIEKFEVWLNDQRLGDAHFGLARQDVGAAFPDWPNALRSGFAFHCPPRGLREGDHTIRLLIQAKNGVALERAFQATIKKSDDHADSLSIRRRIPRVEADMLLALLADMNYRPEFRLVIRRNETIDTAAFRLTLKALRLQAYDAWTLTTLAADSDATRQLSVLVAELEPRLKDRVRIVSPEDAVGWAAPLASSSDGRSVLHAVLRPGDEPGADALLELALAAGRWTDRDLLYGDEVRISPVSNEKEPFFKPDFSPDLLLSTNYIGRLWVATSALLARTNVTPASLEAAGEYDLVLRCVEHASGVHHVTKLLCQRRSISLDNPELEEQALANALTRRGIAGEVLATPVPGTWRIKRAVAARDKVSIIIPTCAAHGHIETCIATLRAKTSYPNYEIICVDNIPKSETTWKKWLRRNADKTVNIPGAFNWSTFNNRATEVAEGSFLLFLNDDVEIVQDDWLDALVEHAQRPEVGIVGPQLLYRDGKVQHAGMFLAANGIGRHAFRFAARDEPCYFGLALTQRNVIAVTGACMLVRKETFERLGRFDEAHEIINNDLDFCLRVHRSGLLTVYTPYATLIHYELASRANLKDVYDLMHFNMRWKTTFAAGDPYFSPRLSLHTEDYRPDDEPVQWAVAGAPIFHVHEIVSILVIKLDHIGDFVTALPPIRRLRQIFPDARLTVLAGPASKDFISLEPSIDEFIPFSFFHARSQLGEKSLGKDDFTALAEQLSPYRFDLAIDLRKHPSTRDVLRHTGARFLAGFDYLGQFPFLDIALDWDGDRNLQRKRNHIVDDLLALVNAVGHATQQDRLLMQPGPVAMPLAELPAPIRALFDRPVVAIHPGAGNITKQWPEEHFSALIDLLIERNSVNVLLVGGPDDVQTAKNLLQSVLQQKHIASIAGRTTLAELSRLLKNCVLYVGNDSGPKHIAAAVGIPTIGVHSGVVDPVEWGPIGPRAVALRRNMTCSPCYLANAEDCPRSLACLRLLEPGLVYETADMMLKGASRVETPEPAMRPRLKLRRGAAVREPAQ